MPPQRTKWSLALRVRAPGGEAGLADQKAGAGSNTKPLPAGGDPGAFRLDSRLMFSICPIQGSGQPVSRASTLGSG
jgi:hypothetical protein